MFNSQSHIRVYCKRIIIISKKDLPFNLPNHGLVEIIKDNDFYRLALLYVNGEKKSEFNVKDFNILEFNNSELENTKVAI
jgi:hypothetical protein